MTTPPLIRLVDYLWEVQKEDGSFWQNTRVDGTPVWKSQQLDETSLPVVLAWWLGRTGASDWDNIRAAADYVMANGPRTRPWPTTGSRRSTSGRRRTTAPTPLGPTTCG